jgi:hypothetical protein
MTTLPVLGPLEDWTPRRVLQVIMRIVESWIGVGIGVGVALMGWPIWLAFIVGPLAEFLIYEFFFEPVGLAGHYWEREPRTD